MQTLPAREIHFHGGRQMNQAIASGDSVVNKIVVPVVGVIVFQIGSVIFLWLGMHSIGVALGAAGVVLGIVTIGLLRSVLRPVKELRDSLAAMAGNEGDLSRRVEVQARGEMGELCSNYQRFVDQLREAFSDVRERTVRIAYDSTRLKKSIADSNISSERQEELSELISQASAETTSSLNEITDRTNAISELNSRNLTDAKVNFDDLVKVTEMFGRVRNLIIQFRDTVDNLGRNSENVQKSLSMVQDFSDQTNLLALNAAIEAARAGEMGRGFAVVADEVRTLAGKVREAAEEISTNIGEMAGLVDNTQKGTHEIDELTAETREVIERSSSQFEKLVQDFDGNHGQLIGISSAIEELSATNREVHERVQEIHALSGKIHGEMAQSDDVSVNLRGATEQTLEIVSRFKTGSGRFEEVLSAATEWRDHVQVAMEQLQADGVEMFDHNYRPIPDTKPEKFTVGYGPRFENEIQAFYDRCKERFPTTRYTLAVDLNGYIYVHHAAVSQPLSGDFNHDLLNSRNQRFFTDNENEIRRAKNTAPFLLQTYVRDTGEILCDLSLPIFIKGRHWGGFIMGFEPELIMSS